MIGRLNGTSRRIVALAVAAVAGRKRFKLTMTLMPQGFDDRFQPAAATRHLSREVQAGWGDCLTVLVKRRRLNLLMVMMTMMMMVVMTAVMGIVRMMMMMAGTCSLRPARYIWTLIHFFFRLQMISSQSQNEKHALNGQIRAMEPNKQREKCATNTGQFVGQILVVRESRRAG